MQPLRTDTPDRVQRRLRPRPVHRTIRTSRRAIVTELSTRLPSLSRFLPHGRTLPYGVWVRRHRAILVILALHAPGLAAFGALRGHGVVHSGAEGAAIALFALGAWLVRRRRRLSSAVSSLGLMTACAVLVHFWDGAIEAHFLFFVMVAVIALYEDWMPFLLSLGFVVGEHAVIGVIAPHAVYDHPGGTANPWLWALIHGAFVLAAAAASLTAWRFNEDVRADHRRAAADAEASRARLSDLVRGLDAIVWEADPGTFRFTFVNERAAELLGHPVERWSDPGFWASILHPEDRWALDLCIQATAEGRDHDFEYRAIAADGRTVWLRDLVKVETDDAGAPRLLRGVMVDITRQKEAEEELRRRQGIIAAVLDATPDDIRLVDLDGNVVLANRAARESLVELPPTSPAPSTSTARSSPSTPPIRTATGSRCGRWPPTPRARRSTSGSWPPRAGASCGTRRRCASARTPSRSSGGSWCGAR
jgi:PAS domain S-box-containing protein